MNAENDVDQVLWKRSGASVPGACIHPYLINIPSSDANIKRERRPKAVQKGRGAQGPFDQTGYLHLRRQGRRPCISSQRRNRTCQAR